MQGMGSAERVERVVCGVWRVAVVGLDGSRGVGV